MEYTPDPNNPPETETPDPGEPVVNAGYLSSPSAKYFMLVCAWISGDVSDFFSHFSIEYDRRYEDKIR
jgi:hypothetical protein